MNSPGFSPWASRAASIAAARRSTGAVAWTIMGGLGHGRLPQGQRKQYRNARRRVRCRRPMLRHEMRDDEARSQDEPPAAVRGLTRAALLRAALALPLGAALPASPVRSASIARMNTRPIPSSREALPVIGCGTYLGFDQAPGSRPTRSCPAWSRRCSPRAARCSTARRCTAAPSRPPASCWRPTAGAARPSSPPRSGPGPAAKASAQMEESMRLLRSRAHRPDAGAQPGRLAHPPGDAARLEGAGPGPLSRHHPLHGVGLSPRSRRCCAPRSSTSCRSTTRSTTAQAEQRAAAARRRARRRGDRQHAVRRRRPAARAARQAAARLGRPRSAAPAGRRCC